MTLTERNSVTIHEEGLEFDAATDEFDLIVYMLPFYYDAGPVRGRRR